MNIDHSVSYLLTGNEQVKKHIAEYFPCSQCSLHENKFKYAAFRGVLPCDVLFIGEAPSRTDDILGVPFIGKTGKILDLLIRESTHTTGNYYYGVTNTVCCIPANPDGSRKTRHPSKEETKACSPRLADLIAKCEPKLIVLLGKVAEKGFAIQDTKVPCLYLQHPAYILHKGGLSSVEYKRNLLDLVEGIETYVKKANKQLSKKNKQGKHKSKDQRETIPKQRKTKKQKSK